MKIYCEIESYNTTKPLNDKLCILKDPFIDLRNTFDTTPYTIVKKIQFCYHLVINSSYIDMMKAYKVENIGKDCDKHLAKTIIEYEDKFKGLLNLNIFMDIEIIKGPPTNCCYFKKSRHHPGRGFNAKKRKIM